MSERPASLPYASYRGRLTFQGVLTLLAPLHVGSGFEEGASGAKTIVDGQSKLLGEVGGIVRGVDDKPVIPSTTIKGALRSLVQRAAGEALAQDMFGDGETTGRPGIAIPYAAIWLESPDVAQRIEKADSAGVYRSHRTAIDGKSGTAAHKKVFARNVVAAGTRFSFRMIVAGDPDVLLTQRRDVLERLLKTLMDEGVCVGSGKGDGQGRWKLNLNEVTFLKIDGVSVKAGDVTPEWRQSIRNSELMKVDRKQYDLELRGEDAFMILGAIDASKKRSKNQKYDNGKDNIERSLRQNDNMPELPGASLMGALRARARWMVALAECRGKPYPGADSLISELFGMDAAALGDESAVDRLAQRAKREPKTKALSAAEITGFAGMLRVVSITAASAALTTSTSVRIDRFTQAPIDNALFASEAFLNPAFQVILALDERATDEHATFIDDLIKDICDRGVRQGLMLGHRSNSGFGWMSVIFKEKTVQTGST